MISLCFLDYESEFVGVGVIGRSGDIGIKAVNAESVGKEFLFDRS